MAGSGDQIKALVRSHASGDDASFYAVALQVAAQAARQGHHLLADDLRKAVDSSRRTTGNVTRLTSTKDDLHDLVSMESPSVRLKELVVPTGLRSQIRQVLSEQRQRKTLAEHGFHPVHRLLLEGPPGTGKTMTAAVLATELGIPLFSVRLDSLMSKFLGETASKLRQIFTAASTRRGVYLFDEFDALGADRGGNDVGEARRVLNSFLLFLEESNADSLIVAATNHRSMLDKALFRRFDLVLEYELPDAKQAVSVIRARLGRLGPEIDWSTVRKAVGSLSHADLVKATESAAKKAVMSGHSFVTTADLVNAIKSRGSASVG